MSRLGGTVVGTHAFRLYEGELNLRLGLDHAAQTDDLDIASFERLSLALEGGAAPPVQQVLADFALHARDETDLDRLTAELQRVVEETMQPEAGSVWLRNS